MRTGVVLLFCVACTNGMSRNTLVRNDQRRVVTTCAALQDALDEASLYSFAPPARWKIEVPADAALWCEAPLLVSHPQGQAIDVRGASLEQTPVPLWFTEAGSGLVLDGGHIGWLDGLELLTTGERADTDVGIHVRRGGTLRLGPNMRVRGFSTGLKAEEGSVVHAESAPALRDGMWPFGLRIEGARVVGVHATSGAVVEAPEVCARAKGSCADAGCEVVSSCNAPGAKVGHGLLVELDALIVARHAQVSCHPGHGAWVRGGTLVGPQLQAFSNGCDGLHVAGDAVGTVPKALFQANGRDGVHVGEGGMVRVDAARIKENVRSGLYADSGLITADNGTIVENNRGHALAVDHGGAIHMEAGSVSNGVSPTPPLDVCAGLGGVVYVNSVTFVDDPWNVPFINIAADRGDPKLNSIVVAGRKAVVLPLGSGQTECWVGSR